MAKGAVYFDSSLKRFSDFHSVTCIQFDQLPKPFSNQGRSQTQNLGGANIFWEYKISEVDFIHFYEN